MMGVSIEPVEIPEITLEFVQSHVSVKHFLPEGNFNQHFHG
jgi:hypothetical protein